MTPRRHPAATRAAKALALLLLALFAVAAPAAAQEVPALSGRVVDQADLLPPDREAALTQKLEALERQTSRQLVVVTVPDLQGYTVEDFGFRLGEAWKIGDAEADNGAILLVAVDERKIRIEVGDGLEPILPDGMAWLIINDTIRPHFQAGDFPAGIEAGADAIVEQLQAPPEVAEERALAAAEQQRQQGGSEEGGSGFLLLFWGMVLLFVLLSMVRGGRRGKKYRRQRRGGVFIWGPGMGGGWDSGGGWGSGGGGWGGGGGFGGFSGGGGSFGGGGASGGW